ncbi:uncharacterized protein IL334_004512 [Kwoniella shivajii]|uniref:Zn(2)-C6 fungal-type domain-containing protein n=1 Tax=Kwoniella shivajii TaxID=564305 RepID=A0ABZ1D0H9_9TREE|nr:hypothetical protein IL334_004512 [Kwoniella shivajii]
MLKVNVKPACLRCRSRKSKCLGRSEGNDCQGCVSAGVQCEIVPHRRGRKVGTRRAQSLHDGESDIAPNARRPGHERVQHPPPHLIRPYAPIVALPSPTSSIRVTSQEYTDIGPSVRRTSSIARIFSEKRHEERIVRPGNLPLWREDPIICGYIDEKMARSLFHLFMRKIAPNVYIFDESLHTYEYVQRTSSFLFCAIIAIAAKFSPEQTTLTLKKCSALAKDQILRVFADDIKSEETVQALFVLTEYKEADDENAFLLLGIVSSSQSQPPDAH